jgi:Cys-rich protein (TIGR01571 family)
MQQCFAAVFPAAVTCALISTLGIAAVIIMASRRRIAIRERYGIDGTPMGDLCLWAWCAPCALAQVGWPLHVHGNQGQLVAIGSMLC